MVHAEVHPHRSMLERAAVQRFVEIAEAAVAARGRFAVALSGGSTPKGVYALLAARAYADRVSWADAFVFWGDERCVPPGDPDSNYRMAYEMLLAHVPIPEANLHRVPTELGPENAASVYEDTLRRFFSSHLLEAEAQLLTPMPRFDLVLLGLGVDGHTASLFPGAKAIHERKRWVVAHHVGKLNAWRITLTPAALNGAANVIFLVAGRAKSETLWRAVHGPHDPDATPAQAVRPPAGRVLWLADEEAGALLLADQRHAGHGDSGRGGIRRSNWPHDTDG